MSLDAVCCDRRFNATFDALAQMEQELVAARRTITEQSEEIERLRSEAAAALHVQTETMVQVEKAISIIKDLRTRAAQAEAALDDERAERVRLEHELNVVSEQVGLLFDRLPAT